MIAGGNPDRVSCRVGCQNEQRRHREVELLAELFCLLFLREEKEVALWGETPI